MKISYGFLALSLASALAGGCTTKKYYTNGDGGTGSGISSVSGASPSSAFLTSTLDVTLSGSNTSWDATTTVDFGAGIKVNHLNVASASALVANITVDKSAAVGARTVTVHAGADSEAYSMAFNVESAVSVKAIGTTAQGSYVQLTLKNKDLDHLFDTTSTGDGFFSPLVFTNIAFNGVPDGVDIQVSNVTQFEIDATMFVDVKAPAGPIDLDVASGPGDTSDAEFFYPAAVNIAAREATNVSSGTMFALTDPLSSQLFTYTPAAADHYVALDIVSTGSGQPTMVLLDKTGSWANALSGFAATQAFVSTSTDPLYIIALDGSGAGGDTASIQVKDVAVTPTTETNDATNNLQAGAQTLAPPVIVKGATLSSGTDEDWYTITTTAAGTITAATVPGDAQTDTVVTIYSSDGTTVVAQSDDSNYHDSITSGSVAAGTYYVVVTTGTAFSTSASHYNLVVVLN